MSAQRVLCAHADEFDGTIAPATFATRPKVERTMELLEEIFERRQRALVFASFTKSLDRLAHLLRERWPSAFVGVLDGRTPVDERQPLLDTFSMDQHRPGCLLLNPRAGGVGLNITTANHVIHFNPEWNPAQTAQASARSYRRGQDLPVFIYHLFYEQSVEERAVDVAELKRDLAVGVDDGVDG
jgi:SNF2 family DNA or RNA helicase